MKGVCTNEGGHTTAATTTTSRQPAHPPKHVLFNTTKRQVKSSTRHHRHRHHTSTTRSHAQTSDHGLDYYCDEQATVRNNNSTSASGSVSLDIPIPPNEPRLFFLLLRPRARPAVLPDAALPPAVLATDRTVVPPSEYWEERDARVCPPTLCRYCVLGVSSSSSGGCHILSLFWWCHFGYCCTMPYVIAGRSGMYVVRRGV